MKIKKCDLYYVFIAITTLVFYIRYFNFESNVIKYSVYVMAAVGILVYIVYWIKENFTLKERILHFILIIGIFLVYYFSGMKYEYLIFTVLAIIGIKNKSLKKIMSIIFTVYFLCLILHILLVSTGIIKDEVFVKVSSGKKIETHKFGFSHGNAAFTILFTCICSYLYCKYDKIKIIHLITIEIISISLYFIFYARTGFIIITLLLIGFAIFKYIKTRKNMRFKIFRYFEIAIVPTMFIGTYLLSTNFFNTKIATIINRLVSNRLKISNIYFTAHKPGLFPNNYEFIGDIPFDNMFSFIILSFGFIFTTFIIIMYVNLYIKLLKKKKYFEMYLITLFTLYSYSERMYINAFRNPTILFLGVLLYKNYDMFDCESK